MKKKHLKYAFYLILILLILTEVSLRLIYGFCDAVLFREDKDFEYIPVAQNRKRFGNKIFYNSFSQRNEEISEADSIRIAIFGDSIINGGALSDQDSLATTKLTNYLTVKYKKPVKVLNISAGSWGPDNCFAYLKKYGNFNARKIVMVVSSHDAYDNMGFEKLVGTTLNYPSIQYHFAISELIERYLIPWVDMYKHSNTTMKSGINKRKGNSPINSGFRDFYNYCKEKNIPFLIYLHAELDERELHEYNYQGKDIINFCCKYSIPLIKDLNYPIPPSAYRDYIHFNSLGQEKLFEILKDRL